MLLFSYKKLWWEDAAAYSNVLCGLRQMGTVAGGANQQCSEKGEDNPRGESLAMHWVAAPEMIDYTPGWKWTMWRAAGLRQPCVGRPHMFGRDLKRVAHWEVWLELRGG